MTDVELKELVIKADLGSSIIRMRSAFDAVHRTCANLSVWERDEPGAQSALGLYADENGLTVDSRELADGQVVLYVERRTLRGEHYLAARYSFDVYLTRASSDAYLLTKTLPSSDGK